MAWGMVFITNAQNGLSAIGKKSWIFLILSGVATGLSWLCYYKALKDGSVSVVVPIDKLSVVITMVFAAIFLHEQFTQNHYRINFNKRRNTFDGNINTFCSKKSRGDSGFEPPLPQNMMTNNIKGKE